MNIATAMGLLTLVVAVPLNAYVFVFLRRLDRESPNAVLRILTLVFFLLTLLATVFGLTFTNNDMAPGAWSAFISTVPILSTDQTRVITRGVILGVLLLAPLTLIWHYRQR